MSAVTLALLLSLLASVCGQAPRIPDILPATYSAPGTVYPNGSLVYFLVTGGIGVTRELGVYNPSTSAMSFLGATTESIAYDLPTYMASYNWNVYVAAGGLWSWTGKTWAHVNSSLSSVRCDLRALRLYTRYLLMFQRDYVINLLYSRDARGDGHWCSRFRRFR